MELCPGGNVTYPIWRVLASSDGISSWTPLKPQHSDPNPNPNPLANQLYCTDFLTPPTLIIPQWLEFLMELKNWCSIHGRWLKYSVRFCGLFSKFKTEIYCISHSKVSSRPDCIFEIHQLCQSGFSSVYSNSCCSCSFDPEIIKIGQSSHNKSLTTILNAWTKKKRSGKFIECTTYIDLHMCLVYFFCELFVSLPYGKTAVILTYS